MPLFPAFSSLTIDLADIVGAGVERRGGSGVDEERGSLPPPSVGELTSARAHFNFEGDFFEMEDQRNWTDASFKTYCTPLSLGFPHQARAGSRIAQSFTVWVEGTPMEKGQAETLEAQAETVKSARAFSADRPIIVSPITLKRRYNPHATVAETEKAPHELPDAVDPRQMSLFGAAWTAGSIKYLAESGAASLTYYETTGWQGLIERETGSPLPELFPSAPGMVFPLYHVFADVAEWKEGTIVECSSNRPFTAVALAVESAGSLVMSLKSLDGLVLRMETGVR